MRGSSNNFEVVRPESGCDSIGPQAVAINVVSGCIYSEYTSYKNGICMWY